MTRLTFLSILSFVSLSAVAQQKHETFSHKGFYLSLAAGPAFGDIKGKDHNNYPFITKGTAFGFDAQIGGAIQTNLILHGTLQIKSIYGPKINDVRFGGKYSFDENFFGAGMTKYTAENFFITGNVGLGYYTLSLETNNPFASQDVSTDMGFSFNIRAGKEWMVSGKWGLGAVLFFNRTSLKTRDETFTEKWNSNRFGIYFQATYNRLK
ncbi:MAG: hypothetical protein ABI675_09980 [Chitinophagaceae bacterium]